MHLLKKKIIEDYLLIIFLINAFLFNAYRWPIDGIEKYPVNLYLGFVLMSILAMIKFLVDHSLHLSTKYFVKILSFTFLINFLFSISQPLCQFGMKKMIISDAILIFLATISFDISVKSSEEGWKKLPYAAMFILTSLVAFCFVEYFAPFFWPEKEHYRDIGLYSGILGEPSYLGWASVTLIGLIFLGSNILKIAGVILWAIIFLFSPSGTFLILSFFLFFYFIFIKARKILLGFFVFALIATLLYFDLTNFGFFEKFSGYIFERIVTVFVIINPDEFLIKGHGYYAQGILDSWNAFLKSFGLGVGHNRMGCLESYPGRILDSLPPDDQPMARGGFLFAKIFYEWGFVGLLFFYFIAHTIFKTYFLKRNLSQEISLFILYICTATWVVRSNLYTDHLYFVVALPPILLLMKNNKLENK